MKPAMISFMGLDGSASQRVLNYAYEQLKKQWVQGRNCSCGICNCFFAWGY